VISQSATGAVSCGTVVNLVVSLGQFPVDDFNDGIRGAAWRIRVDSPESTDIVEEVNRLNIITAGGLNMMASCVGHWTMNDNAATTTVLDSSGKGHNGTAQQNTSVLHTNSGNPPHLNGALTFNGTSDYINVGPVIGTGAYTKVAWVKRADGANRNNIISSDTSSNVFWAPDAYSFVLSAGHNGTWNKVQDTTGALAAERWYFVAVTYDPAVAGGTMVLYKDGVPVSSATGVGAPASSTTTYIGRFSSGYNFKGAIDEAAVFNRALSDEEISYLYNGGDGTEAIPAGDYGTAFYTSNGWSFDVTGDFEARVDYHYGDASGSEGRVEMAVESDDGNYVSLSAGFEGSSGYFYYEKAVDGDVTSGQASRVSDDGTLYISYDAGVDELYLSYTGYGSVNAWQTISGLLAGQWSSGPVRIAVGGGSFGASLGMGEAYVDNFKVESGLVLGWPPVTDIDGNGFIEWNDLKVMCDNWLAVGSAVPGDVYKDGDDIVNLLDLAEFGLAW
jgi:hypothetical protein